MKLSLLTSGLPPQVVGGMERHSYNLAKALCSPGVALDVYYPNKQPTKTAPKPLEFNTPKIISPATICVPWLDTSRIPGHYIRSLKKYSEAILKQYLNRPPANFIISKSLTGWAFVEAKQAGLKLPPIAVNAHGYEVFQRAHSLSEIGYGLLMRPSFRSHLLKADFVYSYGAKVTNLLEEIVGVPTNRIIEIPGGVDHNWLCDKPKPPGNPLKFAFLGRYERRKGIKELTQAILLNPHWNGKMEMHFIGPIPESKQLNRSNVFYHGRISEPSKVKALLSTMDILICPSHSEGMPNVIMEAMASGLAIIATDVGATQLLVSSENGDLISSGTCQSIKRAVDEILSLPAARILTMKKTSREKIQQFTWKRIAKLNLDAIQARLQT